MTIQVEKIDQPVEIADMVGIAKENPFNTNYFAKVWNLVNEQAESEKGVLVGDLEPTRQAAESFYILTILAKLGQPELMKKYVEDLLSAGKSQGVIAFYESDESYQFRTIANQRSYTQLSDTQLSDTTHNLEIDELRADITAAVDSGWVTTESYSTWLEQFVADAEVSNPEQALSIDEAREIWLSTGPTAIKTPLELPEEEMAKIEAMYVQSRSDVRSGLPFKTTPEAVLNPTRGSFADTVLKIRDEISNLPNNWDSVQELKQKDMLYANVFRSDAFVCQGILRELEKTISDKYVSIVEAMSASADDQWLIQSGSQHIVSYWENSDSLSLFDPDSK